MSETKPINKPVNPNFEPELGALWIREGKAGKYLSIKLELNGKEINLVGFKNRFKEGNDNRPDYRLYNSKKPGEQTTSTTPTKKAAKKEVVAEPVEATNDF